MHAKLSQMVWVSQAKTVNKDPPKKWWNASKNYAYKNITTAIPHNKWACLIFKLFGFTVYKAVQSGATNIWSVQWFLMWDVIIQGRWVKLCTQQTRLTTAICHQFINNAADSCQSTMTQRSTYLSPALTVKIKQGRHYSTVSQVDIFHTLKINSYNAITIFNSPHTVQ